MSGDLKLSFHPLQPDLKSCADTKLDQELLPCRPHKALLQMNSASFFRSLARPINRCGSSRPTNGHPVYPAQPWGPKRRGAQDLGPAALPIPIQGTTLAFRAEARL
jgi:hypothetical protein